MDDNLGYLFAAFAISWLGIAAYLVYVSQQVRTLQEDLDRTGNAAESGGDSPDRESDQET